MFELHYQLRTEGGSPERNAVAVGLGSFLGCIPIYGLHLFLCAAFARMFRLSRVRTYLAAHVSNPLTFAPLTLLEFGVGRWLTTGTWPRLRWAELTAGGPLHIGRDLAVGTLVVGVGVGAVFGLFAWVVGRRWSRPSFADEFRESVSRRYTRTGIRDWEYARARLRHDPVHRDLLRAGALGERGPVLDLGCGEGLLLTSIAVAREARRAGRWPATWSSPPEPGRLIGIERRRRPARTARRAIGADGVVRLEDLRHFRPPPFRVAVLVDVLHDLPEDEQDTVLERLRGAMEVGGRLVLREIDAAAGWRAWPATAVARVLGKIRDGHRSALHFRTAAGWRRLLERHGFDVETAVMRRGFRTILVGRDPRSRPTAEEPAVSRRSSETATRPAAPIPRRPTRSEPCE